MTSIRPHSLQLRLAIRLAALYVAAIAIAMGALIYQAYQTAGSLNDRELDLRAADLAQAIVVDISGNPRLELPSKLASAYAAAPEDDLFAIRDARGRVVLASTTEFGERVAKWPAPSDEPSYFRIRGPESEDYHGLSIALPTAAGPMWISIARTDGSDALVRSLLRQFVIDALWVSPILMVATLGIGIFAIRNGLKPMRDISRIATSIGPNTTSVRLPGANLPSEIKPLVDAVNSALDRLEKGFAVQRQFTANAAHEIRTPLAIVTGALEAMEGNGELLKLKADVARMNRLVEQLLRVARLDAVALEFEIVELNGIACSVVESLAPWAIAQKRSVAFVNAEEPVRVHGNAHAIADAIRNLIENGVMHSPPNGEVTVTLYEDGRVSVADHGHGVPLQDRENIFDRFWRGKAPKTEGSGLGLAIVSEIMKAHTGSVEVADNPGGGAIFTLAFPVRQPRIIDRSEPRDAKCF